MVRAVVSVDGCHTDGVGVSPVHAGLFAAAHDQDAHGGLDVARSDVVSVLPEPSVAHVVLALLKVREVSQRLRGCVQFVPVEPAEALHGAFRADPVEEAPAEAVLLLRRGLLQPQGEAAAVEVVGGVGEVVGEQGVREGVAEGVLQGGLPVGEAEHARHRAVAARQAVPLGQRRHQVDSLAGDDAGERLGPGRLLRRHARLPEGQRHLAQLGRADTHAGQAEQRVRALAERAAKRPAALRSVPGRRRGPARDPQRRPQGGGAPRDVALGSLRPAQNGQQTHRAHAVPALHPARPEPRKKRAEKHEQVFARRREQARVGLRRALRDAVRAAGRGLQLPQDGLDVRPFRAGQPQRTGFFYRSTRPPARSSAGRARGRAACRPCPP